MRLASVLLGLAVTVFLVWSALTPSEPERSVFVNPPRKPAIPATAPAAQTPAAMPEALTVPPPDQAPPLADEGREAERLAAIDGKGTASPPKTELYYRVTVKDGGTLDAGGVIIKLAGIKAREADAVCKDSKGRVWPCGAAARTALMKLVRNRAVSCELPAGGEQSAFTTRCTVGGTDLSTWMVGQGWAEPHKAAEAALAETAREARAARLGLWREAE